MKQLIWIGSSHEDLKEFPVSVRNAMGYALYRGQIGKKHEHARVLGGMGNANIVEIRENDKSGTYRVVYTVEFHDFVVVLHAFQKKSKQGITTPKQEIELLKSRLKDAKILMRDRL